MDYALEINSLKVSYPPHGHEAVSGITLRIAADDKVAILGLNGCGKTSLLLAMTGLVSFKGDIKVLDLPLIPRNYRDIRRQIGFLFSTPDDQILFANVLDDVSYSLERLGTDRATAREKARFTLDKLGILKLADHSPHQLSIGQRQRVALAGALVSSPKLLILDEPTAALDPVGKQELLKLIEGNGSTLITATHDLDFAASVCRRFIVLHQGRVHSDSRSITVAREYIQKQVSQA